MIKPLNVAINIVALQLLWRSRSRKLFRALFRGILCSVEKYDPQRDNWMLKSTNEQTTTLAPIIYVFSILTVQYDLSFISCICYYHRKIVMWRKKIEASIHETVNVFFPSS